MSSKAITENANALTSTAEAISRVVFGQLSLKEFTTLLRQQLYGLSLRRRLLGLTKAEFCAVLGISTTAFDKWADGSRISLKTLKRAQSMTRGVLLILQSAGPQGLDTSQIWTQYDEQVGGKKRLHIEQVIDILVAQGEVHKVEGSNSRKPRYAATHRNRMMSAVETPSGLREKFGLFSRIVSKAFEWLDEEDRGRSPYRVKASSLCIHPDLIDKYNERLVNLLAEWSTDFENESNLHGDNDELVFFTVVQASGPTG